MSNVEQLKATDTVQQITFRLMRELNMTKIFGNPGSTELNFLNNIPDDFEYVLALQEASAVAMADGYAQASNNAAFVNLHSAAGVGHALGNIFTAYRNHSPLVVTAGQQSRSILPFSPYLGAEQPAEFPKPYVKWSIEPARPEDVPVAIAQAYHIAMQHPRGPTFVSIPSDDWDKLTEMPKYSKVIGSVAPSPEAIDQLLQAVQDSHHLALVVGSDIDRQGGFESVVNLAERLQAEVWEAPNSSRASFPEDHPQFAGFLSALPQQLCQKLMGYDAILIIGAPVFTLHLPGEMPLYDQQIPIYQITDDPMYAASSSATTTLLGNIVPSIQAILDRLDISSDQSPVNQAKTSRPIRSVKPPVKAASPIPVAYAVDALAQARSEDSIIVEEAPSHRAVIQRYLPITKPNSFYTMASGGLGYSLPASVGVALATQKRVICVIGDGSTMYSVQAIWTAVEKKLPVTIIVLNNSIYGALRSFGEIMNTPTVPGLDLPHIDFVQLAESMGCRSSRVTQCQDLSQALKTALNAENSYLLEIVVDA